MIIGILFKTYGIKYNKNKNNLYLHCMMNYDIDKRKEVIGSLTIDDSNPLKARWDIEESQLPTPNIQDVNAIIDPHDHLPQNIEGERYLIVESIGNNTKIWGKLFDKYNNEISEIPENCIIEYKNGVWKIDLNPNDEPAIYYVRDLNDFKYLYTFNEEYNCWVDVINKKYRPGMWRLSEI